MSNAQPVITIPDDLEACQALVEQLAGTIGDQAKTIDELNREKEELKLAYNELLQQAFRRRSEWRSARKRDPPPRGIIGV